MSVADMLLNHPRECYENMSGADMLLSYILFCSLESVAWYIGRPATTYEQAAVTLEITYMQLAQFVKYIQRITLTWNHVDKPITRIQHRMRNLRHTLRSIERTFDSLSLKQISAHGIPYW